MKRNKRAAFSLIELSIVIVIIGILISGIFQGTKIIQKFKISTARNLTTNSPVASIKDLVLWLDSTSEDSFDEDEAVDGVTISNWYDINPSSAAGNDAVNNSVTDSDHPIYQTKCLNGLPCVRFNGTGSWIDTTKTYGYTYKMTVFAVTVTPQITASDSDTILAIGQSWGEGSFNLKKWNGLFYQLPGAGPSLVAGDTVSAGNYIHTIVDNDDTALSMYLNGESTKEYTSGLTSKYKDLEVFNIGSSRTSGTRTNFLDGKICELIIFARALNDEDRKSVEQYLGQKWGIKLQ